MSNIIKIKHGQNPPSSSQLEQYELGYCINSSDLYIGMGGNSSPRNLSFNAQAGTAIPNGGNLNTYITAGNYFALTNTNNVTNAPGSPPFRLIVLRGRGSNAVSQFVLMNNSNSIYYRTGSTNDTNDPISGSWVLLSGGTGSTTTLGSLGITASAKELNYIKGTTSSIQTQINTLVGNIQDINNTLSTKYVDVFAMGTRIGATSSSKKDLNNYTTNGRYYSASETETNNINNTPNVSTGFALFVMQDYTSDRCCQFLLSNGNLFFRQKSSKGWAAWKQFTVE